ncbi:MAG: hypothetical protein WBL44_08475 [Nitrososphaeraceae archaeon]
MITACSTSGNLNLCVWYHVEEDGKISSIKVIFDPRAFLAGAKQK